MPDNYNLYIKAINEIFERRFSEAYARSSPKRRARLLPFISTIYRRWYYSALLEDTILTPANLIESVNRGFNKNPCAVPSVRKRGEQRYTGLNFEMVEYETDNHPVIEDMRALLNFFGFELELDSDDCVSDELAVEASELMSLRDPHYAAFLLAIALQLKLIVKLPSLYANKAHVARGAKKRLSGDRAALFKSIAEAAFEMAVSALNNMILLPEPVFTEDFVRSLFKQPMETDEIFQRVYDTMGVTVDDLLALEEDGASDLDEALLSGTYMIGIIIDKYLFTPFGHFLKLIRPIYTLPFDFTNEIQRFLGSGFREDALYTAFFAPCSRYAFTDLGLKFFGVTPADDNYTDIKRRLPFDMLKREFFNNIAAFHALPNLTINASLDAFARGEVYSVRIKSETQPALWYDVELTPDTTLHRLYAETALGFNLAQNGDYSFFHSETESPFTEYPSPQSRPNAKKNANITLESLDFTHCPHLILAAYKQAGRKGFYRQPASRFFIEFKQARQREHGKSYPCVIRISKGLRNYFMPEE